MSHLSLVDHLIAIGLGAATAAALIWLGISIGLLVAEHRKEPKE